MKSTLLFTAAIFLSVASFAQTSINSQTEAQNATGIQANKSGAQVNNSGSLSAATEVQSNAGSKVKSGAQAAKNSTVAAKNKAVAKTKTEAATVKKATGKDVTVSAGSQANTDVRAGTANNNISSDASLSGETHVSTAATRAKAGQVKAVVAKTGESIKATGTASVQKVRTVKPIRPVKVNSAIHTTSAIGIH